MDGVAGMAGPGQAAPIGLSLTDLLPCPLLLAGVELPRPLPECELSRPLAGSEL